MTLNVRPNPYVIFDRDGTLIDLVPYLVDLNKVRIKEDATRSLKNLMESRFRLGVISNQSVVGRGLASVTQVEEINMFLSKYFNQFEIYFDFFLICPHTPDDHCQCRKPRVALGLEVVKKFGLSSSECYYIGDNDSDMAFAHNLGWKGVQITSQSIPSKMAHYHADSLFKASKWVISDFGVI